MQVTPGFRCGHLLTMHIDLRSDRYTKPDQAGAFGVAKLPGALSTAVVKRCAPFGRGARASAACYLPVRRAAPCGILLFLP
jgi:hypothetical protein